MAFIGGKEEHLLQGDVLLFQNFGQLFPAHGSPSQAVFQQDPVTDDDHRHFLGSQGKFELFGSDGSVLFVGKNRDRTVGLHNGVLDLGEIEDSLTAQAFH